MADRFPGEIHIGGILRVADHDPDDIDLFLDQCAEQPTEWGESGHGDPLTLDTIDEVIDKDTGWITFRDDQACYGEFQELEEICRELGLSYDRTSDAKYEHDGELVRWRPGMEQPLVETADKSGNRMIPSEPIEACLAMFRAGLVEDGIATLQKLIPEIIPLPKFGIDNKIKLYYVEDDEGHHHGPTNDYEEAASMADKINGRIIVQLEELDGCECDSTHEANDTVCRWCYARGRRYWNDPEVSEA